MEDQNMEVYLADNADVVLTVAGDNAAKSSEILDNVESCMSEHQNVYCHSEIPKKSITPTTQACLLVNIRPGRSFRIWILTLPWKRSRI